MNLELSKNIRRFRTLTALGLSLQAASLPSLSAAEFNKDSEGSKPTKPSLAVNKARAEPSLSFDLNAIGPARAKLSDRDFAKLSDALKHELKYIRERLDDSLKSKFELLVSAAAHHGRPLLNERGPDGFRIIDYIKAEYTPRTSCTI